MPYAFIHDVPATEDMYEQIRVRLGEEPPPGLISHVAVPRQEGGLRYLDVWESAAAWERFRDEVVGPVVGEVLAAHGLPHDVSLTRFEELRPIDVWVGQATTTSSPTRISPGSTTST
jgi:hypothetical protein